MSGLNRYAVEVKDLADEILEYLSGDNFPNAKRMLDILGLEGLANMSAEDHASASKLIEQAPSQRWRKLEKMTGRDFYETMIKARYVALIGAKAIAMADNFELVPGMSYRKAAGFSAQAAMRLRPPTKIEILPGYSRRDDD